MGTQWVGPLLVKWLPFIIRHFKYPARYFLLQVPGISDPSLNFPHQGWGNDGSRGWSMCFARRSPGLGSDNPAHHKYHDIKYHPPFSLQALVLTSLKLHSQGLGLDISSLLCPLAGLTHLSLSWFCLSWGHLQRGWWEQLSTCLKISSRGSELPDVGCQVR